MEVAGKCRNQARDPVESWRVRLEMCARGQLLPSRDGSQLISRTSLRTYLRTANQLTAVRLCLWT